MTRRTIVVVAALAALGLLPAVAGAQVDVPSVGLPPAVSACQVTLLDADSVKVAGSVDPNGLATSYRVEYGLGDALDLSSPAIAVGSLPDPTAISVQLDGLVPNTSYSCRLVALNVLGQIAGSTTTFVVPQNAAGGSPGSGGSGAAPSVNPVTGQVVSGGSGQSVVCTLTGTDGNDRLRGTKRRDVICGLGGADRIVGLAGNDTVIGGAGNDRIRGGAGKDRLWGNRGRDRLRGGTGRDASYGGRGADQVYDSKGRDRLAGGAGRDRLSSSGDRRGGDRLHGGRGRDRASMNRGDRKRSVERVRWSRR